MCTVCVCPLALLVVVGVCVCSLQINPSIVLKIVMSSFMHHLLHIYRWLCDDAAAAPLWNIYAVIRFKKS